MEDLVVELGKLVRYSPNPDDFVHLEKIRYELHKLGITKSQPEISAKMVELIAGFEYPLFKNPRCRRVTVEYEVKGAIYRKGYTHLILKEESEG